MPSGIVFVHLGPRIPAFLDAAIRQARLFSTVPVYLVGGRRALKHFASASGHVSVASEDLVMPSSHRKFVDVTRAAKRGDSLWTRATERFFFVAALMQELGLENVIHLEGDNMLYVDQDVLVPRLEPLYSGVAAPFMDDDRAIGSLVFVRNARAIQRLSTFIADNVGGPPTNAVNDMSLLFAAHAVGGTLDPLPILPSGLKREIKARNGSRPRDPCLYVKHANEIGLVFDAAAIGQYLGGLDNRRPWYRSFRRPDLHRQPGFLNDHGFMDPSQFGVTWKPDGRGRSIPILIDGARPTPIANLHIHSKALNLFSSLDLRLPVASWQPHDG